jgi:hypothetical protein
MRACAVIVVTGIAASAHAQVICNVGNWSGSSRSWNAVDFSSIKATMIGGGYGVEADGPMSAANLANDDIFIMGEPAVPSAGEIADLSAWINSGGIAVIGTDSNGSGAAGANAILAGVGSSIVVTPSFNSFTGGPLAGGVFFTQGPPYNIVGQNLITSPGNMLSGGLALADVVHVEQIGAGWVFVMADRFDHNFVPPSNANPNGKIFLNFCIPSPGSAALLALGGIAAARRRR